MNSTTTLVSCLHDPEGRILRTAQPYLVDICRRYQNAIVTVTDAVIPEHQNVLRNAGFVVIPIGAHPWERLGTQRLQGLEGALRVDADRIHLCDFDRIVHWHRFWSEELTGAIRSIRRSDFVAFNRTSRAWQTYPPQQVLPELIAVGMSSLIAKTGKYLDLYSGSYGFSRRATEIVTYWATENFHGGEFEWPILIKKHLPRARFAVREVEGLEWEDPDYYAKEIALLGRDKWAESIVARKSWEARISVTWRAVLTLLAHLDDKEAVQFHNLVRSLTNAQFLPRY